MSKMKNWFVTEKSGFVSFLSLERERVDGFRSISITGPYYNLACLLLWEFILIYCRFVLDVVRSLYIEDLLRHTLKFVTESKIDEKNDVSLKADPIS